MSKESNERKRNFLLAAQKKFGAAVAAGTLSNQCCLMFSRREPGHHLWIRSNHADQLEGKRGGDFFDVSLLPLLSRGRYPAPQQLIVRVWAHAKPIREVLQKNLGPMEGWTMTAYPRKKGTLDSDPQGVCDYAWVVDWEHLPNGGWDKIIAGYKSIEGQLIKAGLFGK